MIYHLEDLRMKQTAIDPCLFYKRTNEPLVGIEAALVDDTLSAGTREFANLEDQKSKKFDVKSRDESTLLKFGGCTIQKDDEKFIMTQQDDIEKLQKVLKEEWTPEGFTSTRGKLSWVATLTRPDIAYMNAALSQKRADNLEEEDTGCSTLL